MSTGRQNCWVGKWLQFAGCMNVWDTPPALWILGPGHVVNSRPHSMAEDIALLQ